MLGRNTLGRALEPLPDVCNLLIANTWAGLAPRMPDEGCVHPTPGVLFFVKETGVSYTRVRGQLLQVGNDSVCLHFVLHRFLQLSWGGPLKSLSLSLFSRQCVCDYRLLNMLSYIGEAFYIAHVRFPTPERKLFPPMDCPEPYHSLDLESPGQREMLPPLKPHRA